MHLPRTLVFLQPPSRSNIPAAYQASTTAPSPENNSSSRHSHHAKPRNDSESETLILERERTMPRVRLLLDSQIVQHWSTGQSQ